MALVGDVYCIFVTFPCGILGQVWYLIVSFADFCLLSYFEICQQSTTSFNVLFRWEEAGEAYLSESWKRQVMWYVKDDSKLGMLDTDQKYRLEHTLQRTAVSRKLLAFQVNMILIIITTSNLIHMLCRCCFICFYFNNHGLNT